MTAQWLREKSDHLDPSWVFDAPWAALNDPDHGRYLWTTRGLGLSTFKMAAIPGRCEARSLFYGDPVTNPGEMTGLMRHYGSRDVNEAQSAANVLDAGGMKDLCSVWLIGWAPKSICMASRDGLPSDECALCVMDWRFAVRIANVDTVHSPDRLLEMTARAMYRLPALGGSLDVRPVFYMNRDARNALKDGGLIVPDDASVPVMLRGIPIREVAELRSDEARV